MISICSWPANSGSQPKIRQELGFTQGKAELTQTSRRLRASPFALSLHLGALRGDLALSLKMNMSQLPTSGPH